jgi:hypothetical protein
MQQNGGGIEAQLRMLVVAQHQTEERVAALQRLILWSLGAILWWVLRIDDDIGPIKPSDLPQLSPFMLRCVNDLAPFLVAYATALIVWRITRYKPSASKWSTTTQVEIDSKIG